MAWAPRLGIIQHDICGLSLLILSSTLRGFSSVTLAFPDPLLKNLRVIRFISIYSVPNKCALIMLDKLDTSIKFLSFTFPFLSDDSVSSE